MLDQDQIVSSDADQALTKTAVIPSSVEKLPPDCNAPTVDGLAICRVVGYQSGSPLLSFMWSGKKHLCKAIAVAGGGDALEIGSLVCAAFDQNQCDRPLVIGKLVCDTSKELAPEIGTTIVDDDQIVIQCGKACIQLKSDGTVSIRGTNVASRASHTNRIRGGNVQIN
jgi:hypothetical protein